jgi:ABC-type phosphate transport system substrate-binding protein
MLRLRQSLSPVECLLHRRELLIGLVAAAATALARKVRAESAFRVIVNQANPVDSASSELLTDLFLKRRVEWPDGTSARPVDLTADSETRKEFSKSVLRRSVAAVKSYWQQMIFAGRGVPPPELASDTEVVAYVARHRGGVGYVSANASLNHVKSIAVR